MTKFLCKFSVFVCFVLLIQFEAQCKKTSKEIHLRTRRSDLHNDLSGDVDVNDLEEPAVNQMAQNIPKSLFPYTSGPVYVSPNPLINQSNRSKPITSFMDLFPSIFGNSVWNYNNNNVDTSTVSNSADGGSNNNIDDYYGDIFGTSNNENIDPGFVVSVYDEYGSSSSPQPRIPSASTTIKYPFLAVNETENEISNEYDYMDGITWPTYKTSKISSSTSTTMAPVTDILLQPTIYNGLEPGTYKMDADVVAIIRTRYYGVRKYASMEDNVWTFQALGGDVLGIVCPCFQLEYSSTCNTTDFLQISDLSDSKRYCGDGANLTSLYLFTRDGTLMVWFHSDQIVENLGFECQISNRIPGTTFEILPSVCPKQCECGLPIRTDSLAIEQPWLVQIYLGPLSLQLGSLISDRYVITRDAGFLHDVTFPYVTVEVNGIQRGIVNVFTQQRGAAFLAVLELDYAIENAIPVCLPNVGDVMDNVAGLDVATLAYYSMTRQLQDIRVVTGLNYPVDRCNPEEFPDDSTCDFPPQSRCSQDFYNRTDTLCEPGIVRGSPLLVMMNSGRATLTAVAGNTNCTSGMTNYYYIQQDTLFWIKDILQGVARCVM